MKNARPSKLFTAFLELYCRRSLFESIIGDLEEQFEEDVNTFSVTKAKRRYIWNVIRFFRPGIIKPIIKTQKLNQYDMFKNYFKIAWRSLTKYKMYSAIKIGGFSIGIAAFLLILLFVKDELSYDKHYDQGDRIFRVINVHNDPSNFGRGSNFPAQIGQALRDNFPELEKVGRLISSDWFNAGNNQFRAEDNLQSNYEEGFAYADQDLLEILEIEMVYGDQKSALSKPNSMVISKRKADKYFPDQDPVGQTIILNEEESEPILIGGVMENFPTNSHLQFDFFITLTGEEFWPGEQTNWCCWNYSPYIRITQGSNPKELEEKLLLIKDNYIVKNAIESGSSNVDNIKKYFSFYLQPVANIYLESEGIGDDFSHGDIKLVWLFVAIAIFILLLACINFINLSTAKSSNRAKEIGLRKVIGSFRSNLIQQFLTESILYSAISVTLGIGLAILFLPYFNEVSDKSLVLPFAVWWVGPSLIVFILIIGLIAGVYPAFYLSAFKPIDVLRGSKSKGSKSSKLRNVMVVFQFTTSIVLIVGAMMVYRQMEYILNKDLGFDKDQVIMLQGANTLGNKLSTFKNELLKLPEVQSAALSNYLPVEGTKRDGNTFYKEGRDKIDKDVSAQCWKVDKDYVKTMGMKILEGRGFSDRASDSSAIIINQTMAKKLNLENPIGERIKNWESWNIIGVVEDFHFSTIKYNIRPLSLVLGNEGSIIAIKVDTKDMAASLTSITQTWDVFMPNQPVRYSFLDEAYARMYEDVQRTANLFTIFAFLAIIVACLGLFGLSAFLTEQRSKEISIRKVLGASFQVIFQMLTFDFLKMIVISIILAIPIGWYLMTSWLADFEYRTDISWDVFAIAGIIVVLIALFTVSFESIKASIVNPVKGLKSD